MKRLAHIVVAVVLLFATVGEARNDSIATVKSGTYAELLSEAGRTGAVPVIVTLAHGKPAAITPSNYAIIQTDIAKSQGDFLTRVAGYNVSDVKKLTLLPIIYLKADALALGAIADDPAVESIQRNHIYAPLFDESASFGEKEGFLNSKYTGKGQTVAMLDTGVDKTNPALYNKIVAEVCSSHADNYGADSSLCQTQTGADVTQDCNDAIYGCGHGTTAAIAAAGNGTGGAKGVAFDAGLMPAQIYYRSDSPDECGADPAPCIRTNDYNLLRGLDFVYGQSARNRIAAVALSVKSGAFTGKDECATARPAMRVAFDYLRAAGIAPVVADETTDNGKTPAPACLPNAVSVNANPGSFLKPVGKVDSFFNSPQVAGVWAIIKQALPNADVDEALAALRRLGKYVAKLGGVGYSGDGLSRTSADSTKGTLLVYLSPQEAIDAGGMWGNGVQWANSGESRSIYPGTYTIKYKTISNWIAQDDQTVAINAGSTTRIYGVYYKSGSLKVTLSPSEAIAAGAKWAAYDGSSEVVWRKSGETVSLQAKSYVIWYNTVDGYIAPTVETVTVEQGKTTTVTATYKLNNTGSLTTTITPAAAVSAGAQWAIYDGTSTTTWRDSGSTVKINAGNYIVRFQSINGWHAPSNQTVTVSKQAVTSVTGTYRQYATLTVNISPQAVVDAGGTWSVDGTTWKASGASATIPSGDYKIVYSTVTGYDKPTTNTSVTLADGESKTVTGTYTVRKGTVTVSMTPQAALDAGAMWGNGVNWAKSGSTYSVYPGTYTIKFNTITGYNSPASQTITIRSDQNTNVTAAYTVQPGSVSVNVGPQEAVTTGGKWTIDGRVWRSSGETVSVSPGSYPVYFSSLTGWTTPTAKTLTVNPAQKAAHTGTYVRKTGQMAVTIYPSEAVTAGATFGNGVRWGSPNVTYTVKTGTYNIYFKDVSGWYTPASQTVTINADIKANAYATYKPKPGGIKVSLAPQGAITAGAKWSLDGVYWRNSGDTMSLPTGKYTILFDSVNMWESPASQTVTVSSDNTTQVTGTYRQLNGYLRVYTSPTEATNAGAKWSPDGSQWYTSGQTATLTKGTYTLQYTYVNGYDKPAGQTVTITANQTTTVTGVYNQQNGGVTAIITPQEAVDAGAQWGNGKKWWSSGNVVYTKPGTYTIYFSSISGYDTPAAQSATVQSNQTTTLYAKYVRQGSTLTVTLSPSSAISAGAKWTVDNGTTWRDSGTITLSPGTYTVRYKSISGWTTPVAQNVTIYRGSDVTLKGNYTGG